LILLLGGGAVASVVLFGKGVPGEVVNGGATNINLAWGLAVAFAVAISGKVSGGHLNPAVTLSLAIFRGFEWKKAAPYILAQTLGAFVGSALVFLTYKPAFLRYDPGLDTTAGVFTTFPAFPEMPVAGFIDQVIGTALLLFLVMAVTDEKNLAVPSWAVPLLVGLIVMVIGMCFGTLHGYAINPARDFGPRVFTVLAGFKNNGLTDGTGIWLIPIIGPMLGGIVGTATYEFTLRRWM